MNRYSFDINEGHKASLQPKCLIKMAYKEVHREHTYRPSAVNNQCADVLPGNYLHKDIGSPHFLQYIRASGQANLLFGTPAYLGILSSHKNIHLRHSHRWYTICNNQQHSPREKRTRWVQLLLKDAATILSQYKINLCSFLTKEMKKEFMYSLRSKI
jgi:hypothetical protein